LHDNRPFTAWTELAAVLGDLTALPGYVSSLLLEMQSIVKTRPSISGVARHLDFVRNRPPATEILSNGDLAAMSTTNGSPEIGGVC
jgi:hypothetical protein